MYGKRWVRGLLLSLLIVFSSANVYASPGATAAPQASLLAAGLEGAGGSTVGPDGALYVAEGTAGRISRIDPTTGATTTFASGLPLRIAPIGGVMDVAFIDGTAYALVTLVSSDVGGSDADGIYRIDGPGSFTLVADIGAWNLANPPTIPFDYFVPTGVLYAMEPFRGGFLVTDGHLNRVLWADLEGGIREVYASGDIVPTGLETWGNTVYLAEAGPVPHLPENGKVAAFDFGSPSATDVAAGARLAVDVEFGLGRTLYALSQGFHAGGDPGSPAEADTGALLEVNNDGSMTTVIDGLDRPTSLEFIGGTAYVVSLAGEVWRIDGITDPPYGASH